MLLLPSLLMHLNAILATQCQQLLPVFKEVIQPTKTDSLSWYSPNLALFALCEEVIYGV